MCLPCKPGFKENLCAVPPHLDRHRREQPPAEHGAHRPAPRRRLQRDSRPVSLRRHTRQPLAPGGLQHSRSTYALCIRPGACRTVHEEPEAAQAPAAQRAQFFMACGATEGQPRLFRMPSASHHCHVGAHLQQACCTPEPPDVPPGARPALSGLQHQRGCAQRQKTPPHKRAARRGLQPHHGPAQARLAPEIRLVSGLACQHALHLTFQQGVRAMGQQRLLSQPVKAHSVLQQHIICSRFQFLKKARSSNQSKPRNGGPTWPPAGGALPPRPPPAARGAHTAPTRAGAPATRAPPPRASSRHTPWSPGERGPRAPATAPAAGRRPLRALLGAAARGTGAS